MKRLFSFGKALIVFPTKPATIKGRCSSYQANFKVRRPQHISTIEKSNRQTLGKTKSKSISR